MVSLQCGLCSGLFCHDIDCWCRQWTYFLTRFSRILWPTWRRIRRELDVNCFSWMEIDVLHLTRDRDETKERSGSGWGDLSPRPRIVVLTRKRQSRQNGRAINQPINQSICMSSLCVSWPTPPPSLPPFLPLPLSPLYVNIGH